HRLSCSARCDRKNGPATEPLVRDRLFNVSKKNFEPRAGLAWQPRPKTVLRAGAGIYHDQLLPSLYAGMSGHPRLGGTEAFFGPLLSIVPITAVPPPPPTCETPGTPPPPICAIYTYTTMSWQNKTPAKYEYHFGFEQQLFK